MIRSAMAADADALAALQVRAWARAYADFVPDDAIDEGGRERRRARWRELLDPGAPAEPDRTTLVFVAGPQVAGFASVGAARDEDATPATGELRALYVDPPAQGAGVGAALHDAALGRLREHPFAQATLWVFTENGHGRAFYEARGWTLDDPDVIAREHGDGWWAPAVRYRHAL